MSTSRREFIKTAGAGSLGIAFYPVLNAMDPIFRQNILIPDTPSGSFPRSTPESQGVSSSQISKFIEAVNASGTSWHSFMLLRHGHVVAEGWWSPFEAEFRHSLFSLSKSFTSTAIGLLVKEGKLDIEKLVVDFFPDDLPSKPNRNLRQMKIRHLLTMNSGHHTDTMPVMRNSSEAWTKAFLAHPVVHQPGTHFLYNTGATYMLSAIVSKITGNTLENYLTPRLFEPLQISEHDWETSPQGINTGGYGLRVKTESIAKLGQLYLQKGNWGGQHIVTEDWVNDATGFQTFSQEGNGDWGYGYGYQFWRCSHNCFRGDGAHGQYCVVMPELDAVLAVTEEVADMQKSLNLIWDHLYPAIQMTALPENAADQAKLKHDSSSLFIPVPKGSKTSELTSKYNRRKWKLDSNEFGLEQMAFHFTNEGCEWLVKTGSTETKMIFGWENWIVSKESRIYSFPEKEMQPAPSKLAGTATWTDSKSLQLNMLFVEALNGDKITCTFDGDKLSVNFLNSMAEKMNDHSEKRKDLTGSLS